MDLTFLLQFSLLAGVSFLCAVLSLILITRLGVPARQAHNPFRKPGLNDCVVLFDGSNILDATPSARKLIGDPVDGLSDWQRFSNALATDFPDLEGSLADLAEGEGMMTSLYGDYELDVAQKQTFLRIALRKISAAKAEAKPESVRKAETDELQALRTIAGSTSALIWRQDKDDKITWANSAYLEQAALLVPDNAQAWPPTKLFLQLSTRTETVPGRQILEMPGQIEPLWFDIHAAGVESDTIFTATSAEAAVRAESTLSDFIQTLTKTFATLETGLAIFDKQRRLTMFNPALADLTTLPIELLIERPTLQKVLNALREKSMIPEPKDYQSWRTRIHKMEAVADEGQFEETWSLPNGRTFRVTCQPHPDGALALMIDDISAETSIARQYRGQIETSQAVFDTLEEGIAVFNAEGQLQMSNLAFARLWAPPSGRGTANLNVTDATRAWASQCEPSPNWGDLREFAAARRDRTEWYASVRQVDGQSLSMRVAPLTGGATLVGFTPEKQQATKFVRDTRMADVIKQNDPNGRITRTINEAPALDLGKFSMR